MKRAGLGLVAAVAAVATAAVLGTVYAAALAGLEYLDERSMRGA